MQALCGLPELDNTAVCVQKHPAGFVGVNDTALHDAGRTMGGGIASSGFYCTLHEDRLPYPFAGDGIESVNKHSACSFLWGCEVWPLVLLAENQPGGGWADSAGAGCSSSALSCRNAFFNSAVSVSSCCTGSRVVICSAAFSIFGICCLFSSSVAA